LITIKPTIWKFAFVWDEETIECAVVTWWSARRICNRRKARHLWVQPPSMPKVSSFHRILYFYR